jgi:hypothetical protein
MREDSYRSLGIPSIPPQLAAVVSKAVKPRLPQNKKKRRDGSLELPQMASNQAKLSHCRAVKTLENTMALKLLPDIARALNIRVSSILSPSGIMENKIIVRCDGSEIDTSLKSSLSTIIYEYLDKDFNINFKTRKILMQILGTHGSYVTLVVPESALDQIINGSNGQYNIESMVAARNSLYGEKKDNNSRIPKCIGILKNINTTASYSQESNSSGINYDPTIAVSLEDFEKVFSRNKYLFSTEAKFKTEVQETIKKTIYAKLNDKQKLVIVDNPDLLKLSNISKNTANEANQKVLEKNTKNNNQISANVISRAIFGKSKIKDTNPVFSFPAVQTLRANYGQPMVKQIPSGAVLNIIQPGNPEEPIGHMIMLDADGYPIDDVKHITEQSTQSGRNKQLMELVGTQYYNDVYQQSSTVSDFAQAMYTEVVEREIVERIRTGLGMSTAEIAHHSGFYDVMLARHLSGQYTQVLYVPREYISYMAFDYDDNGMGKSLLDGQRVINSMRVVLAHNDVLASIRNSTGVTTVDVNIDENDPDPDSALELIQDNIIRSQMFDFGNALINSGDTIYHLQRMGYQWNVNNHPSLPDTKATYSRQTGTAPKSDEQLNEYLRKASHYNIGVPPEMVDNSEGAEFATQSVIQNTLFGKQAMQDQQIFSTHLTGLAKRLVMFNGDINNKMYEQIIRFIVTKINEIVVANSEKDSEDAKPINIDKDTSINIPQKAISKVLDWLFEILNSKTALSKDVININSAIVEASRILYNDFIENMEIDLPKPPSVTLESQMQDYNNYVQFVDDVLNVIFADEVFDTELMQADIKSSFIRATVKSRLIYEYLSDKAILPELTSSIGLDENRNPDSEILELSIAHAEFAAKAYIFAKEKLGIIGKAINSIDKPDEGEGNSGTGFESHRPKPGKHATTYVDDRDVIIPGNNNQITIIKNGDDDDVEIRKPGPRME